MTEQLQPQHQLAATKLCEPRSQMLKDLYAAVVNDDDKSLKAVQKLPINTTAERDYSAQETCHLLLQLPIFMSWHRGTSLSFVLALLPCVLASVHVSLVSAFAVLARSVAFSPSPQGFRPLSFLRSAVCDVPMSAVYTSHSFSLSGVHARACCRGLVAVETRDNSC